MRRTHAWHVDGELAARYAAGTATETDAWSLEKHVEACGTCASRVSSAVGAQDGMGAVLAGIRAQVLGAVPRAAPVRRPSARVPRFRGTSPLARVLWTAGPALRGPWLSALALVVLGAVALAYGAGLGEAVRPLLLIVAPVLPLAGVFVSYGPHADPLHEITAATPSGGLRLLLIRTAAVLGASIPALTLTGAALPSAVGGPGAVAWLLPGLALTLAALALGSYVGCRKGASAVAAGWSLAVLLPSVGSSPDGALGAATEAAPYFTGSAVQGCWAGAALVCAALLAVRRRSFDHLETS